MKALVFTVTIQPGDTTKFLRSPDSIARSIEKKIESGMYVVTTGKLPSVIVREVKGGAK